MSLLDELMEPFIMMDRTSAPDGYGGFNRAWQEGAEFPAAATFDSSVQARVAAVNGVTSLYKITTRRSVTLEFHDVVKRKSDGKYFRCTSDGADVKTPMSASLDMRQVTAEEYTLTGTIVQTPTEESQSEG